MLLSFILHNNILQQAPYFQKLMGTLIPGRSQSPTAPTFAQQHQQQQQQQQHRQQQPHTNCPAGVNEGPRAVVLAFFKDVPRDTRGDDLNELSGALRELCCTCAETVELFKRHAMKVPKEVRKSLDDLGIGDKLQEALQLLQADVDAWC